MDYATSLNPIAASNPLIINDNPLNQITPSSYSQPILLDLLPNQTTATLSIAQNITAIPGSTIKVPIAITNATGIQSADLQLSYNTNFLDIAENDILLGNITTNWTIQPNVNEPAGLINLSLFNTTALNTSSGNLLELNFKVKPDAPVGTNTVLDLVTASLNENQIGSSLIDGSVQFEIPSFQVLDFNPTPTGFTARFSRDLNVDLLNLYDGQDATIDKSDVTLIGNSVGGVKGSLVYDPQTKTATFVKTSGLLAPDTYTLTLDSRVDGWVDSAGELLDGDRNNIAGGNFVEQFTIAPSSDRILSIANFSRGPGQSIDVPTNRSGLGISIDNPTGVQGLDLEIAYNPALLNITGANLSTGLPASWQITSNFSTAGLVQITLSGTDPLPANIRELFTLTGNIPNSASYRSAGVISFNSILINEGQIGARGDSAIHAVAYVGDTTGNQAYSGLDSSLVSRVVVGLDSGFDAYPRIDPVIVGDTSGNGGISGLDASFISRRVVGLPQAEIPPIPSVPPQLPAISLVATDAEAQETAAGTNPNSGLFTFTRTGSLTNSLTVNYQVSGTATNGADYNNLTGSLSFAAGSANATITINPISDGLQEPDETVILSLLSNPNYAIATANSATVTIKSDTPSNLNTVTISATDPNAAETPAGGNPNPGVFSLTRTGNTASSLTVNYSIGGSASNGTDYNNLSGAVTFGIGETIKQITINPLADAIAEPEETIILTLAQNANYIIGNPQNAIVTIAADPIVNLPVIGITVPDSDAAEAVTGNSPNVGVFNFTRTGNTANSLIVNYQVSGTAANGVDYNNLNGLITFAAGSSIAELIISPFSDALIEPVENVILTLAANPNYTIGSPNSGTINIADSPPPPLPVVSISATDPQASEVVQGETANPGLFTLTRTGSLINSLTVTYLVAGTATKGVDYNNLGGTVTFVAGSSTAQIIINPVNDTEAENPETVIISLDQGTNYTIGSGNTATVTITDPILIPSVNVSAVDPSSSETVSGQTPNPGIFTFTRTGSTNQNLSLNYQISGTATNGVDYITLPGQLIFNQGVTTAQIAVNPIFDNLVEGQENVIVTIIPSQTYVLGVNSTAIVTIDDPLPLPVVSINATDPNAAETLQGELPNPGLITFTRTVDTAGSLTVNYLVSGSATNGTDYSTLGGSITFASGVATAQVQVNPILDGLVENPETVILTLASNPNYAIASSNNATVTIADSPPLPSVTIAATDPEAGENPLNPGVFTLTRTGNLTNGLTVNYQVAGLANNGVDYNTLTGSTTFAAGSATTQITINPIADAIQELDETIVLTITPSQNYGVGTQNTATVTIIGDAPPPLPTVTIVATDPNGAENPLDLGLFTLTRTGNIANSLTVNYAISGSASNGTDYNNLSTQIVFAAGSATAQIPINPISDAVQEAAETVILTLVGNPSYTIGAASSATVNIAADPLPPVSPDLRGSTFDVVQGAIEAGSSVDINYSLENLQPAIAGSFRVGFYLSLDSNINTSDRLIGSATINNLNGNSNSGNRIINITLPNSNDPFWLNLTGSAFIGMVVDDEAQVIESNENNNSNIGSGIDRDSLTVILPPPNQPDLRGGAFNIVQTTADPGNTVTVNYTIQNIGTSSVGAFRVGFYLSFDNNITPTDTFLSSANITSLAAQGTTPNQTISLTLPPSNNPIWSATTGPFFIGMIIDDQNQIPESNEANNSNLGNAIDRDSFTRTPAPSRADLRGIGFDVTPLSATPGTSIGVTYNIQNGGVVSATPFRVGFYLSTDPNITTGDRLLTSNTINSLGAQLSTGTQSINLGLPQGTDPIWGNSTGPFYIGMIIDDQNQVIEDNEANNSNLGNAIDRDSFTLAPITGSPFNIEFDYSYDTSGYFNDSARRAALEAAATIWESIILDEFPNLPVGTRVLFSNPSGTNNIDITTTREIDDLLIYVGARELGTTSQPLAYAGPGGAFFFPGDQIDQRLNGSDFEPFIGSMTFNSSYSWFYDATPTTSNDIPFNSFDFISVAIHEIGHVLGFGTSDAMSNLVSNNTFTGTNARNRNGGNAIPLQSDASHIQENYQFGGSGETAMDPTIGNGVRKYPTILDVAIFDDIGYTINYSNTFSNSAPNLFPANYPEGQLIGYCGCRSCNPLSYLGSSSLEDEVLG